MPCQDKVIDTRNIYQDLFQQQNASLYSGVFGGPAYYEGNAGRRIYYSSKPWDKGPAVPLAAWTIDSGGKLNLVDRSSETFSSGAIPVVSSNGAANGIVWLVDTHADPQHTATHQLYAYDATNLSQRLVRVDAGTWTSGITPYPVPTVINGKVYVASQGKVMAFG